MKVKKKHLKKGPKIIFVILILLIIVGIYANKKYQEYLYHQTNEYHLLELGYTKEETSSLLSKLNDDQISIVLNHEHINILPQIVTNKYFIFNNLDRYIAYYEANKSIDLSKIVALINCNRDSAYYDKTYPTDTSKDYLMLVNKYYYLDSTYKPEIVNISSSYAYADNAAREDVYDAFKSMYEAAKSENITLIVNSSYRSYEDQQNTWTTRKNNYGKEKADAYAARPGFSEHQTGLALDIDQYNFTGTDFTASPAFTWLSNNAYKYGFILRYPEGKEDLTGYSYESWHYRYVGKDIAQKINNENITFDEYYAYYLAN